MWFGVQSAINKDIGRRGYTLACLFRLSCNMCYVKKDLLASFSFHTAFYPSVYRLSGMNRFRSFAVSCLLSLSGSFHLSHLMNRTV